MKDKNKRNNWVAKHAAQYNRSVIFKDKKKALKRGDKKHRINYKNKECYQIAA
jgi:hypothetical protein